MSDLLERAIAAHGGRAAWRDRSAFEIDLYVGGAAWPLRLRRRPGLLSARVRTTRPWTELREFPRAGHRGIFEPHRVHIEDEGGRTVAERREPRAAFAGLRRKARWDDLDFLYFSGYALWNYLAFPFMLEGAGMVVEDLPHRVLGARFPAGFPTHSPRQRFHLDAGHRLMRHDYTAEVFGGWAKAAHMASDHREFDGLTVATRRRVYPRLPGGAVAPAPVLVALDVVSVRSCA